MNRPLKLSMLVALALTTTQALALGLGQAQVRSTLNRPLLVDIPLKLDYAGEADRIQVALATPEDFARAGINRAQLTVPLTFNVVTNEQGQKVVRVTSTEPVRDPYLDFLMQVNWPKGRMLREYTVLLDPPNMPAAMPTTAPVAAPMRAPATRVAPAVAPAAAAPAAPARAPARVHDGRYGPVQSGESLSRIANATRMSGVTLDQMMLALKSVNPDAFYRDNINALKRGAVLRIPSRDEAMAQTAAAARAAARQQNLDWSNGSATAPVTTAGTRTAASGGASESSHVGDRLALVPPGSDAKAAGGGKAAVQSLNQQLSRTKETLSNEQQQNSVLQSRVNDLEQLSAKNKRLVEMKDAQIAELQQQLAKAKQQPAGNAPAATAPATAAGNQAPSASAPATSPAQTMPLAGANASKPTASQVTAGSKPATTTPARAKAHKPATTHKPAARAASPAPEQAPWYLRPWILAGAGLVILLIILGTVFGRRRGEADDTGGTSLADHFGTSPLGSDAADSNSDDFDAEMDADQRQLLQQLGENPDDIGLHLELVSLYYARHDVEGFEGAAEAMYAHVSDPQQSEWLDVVAMGEKLTPEHPLFADHAEGTLASDERGALDEFDVDAYASEQYAEPPAAEPAATEKRTYSYDFNLTPGKTATPPPAQADTPDVHDTSDQDATGPAGTGDAATLFADEAEPARDMYTDDPVDTKLDLARAYIDMGDHDGARSMLEEVRNEGNQAQQDVAARLLDELS